MWGRGFTSWGDYFELENLSPPPPAGISDRWWSPPPPTPGCEEPAGVLKIRTGNLKIDSVGVLFRKIPAFPRTCYTPSPSPPGCRGGGGWDEGCTAFPFLKGDYIDLSNFEINIWMIRGLLGQCRAKYEIRWHNTSNAILQIIVRYFAWDMLNV